MSPEYREISVDQIILSPFNTRGEVPEEEIQALAETIRQSGGNDVPIKIRHTHGEPPYEVVYGERRLKALKLAGIPTARCIVEDMDDTEVLMQQWMENEEHKELSDYAKAQKLDQLVVALKLNQADLAIKLGKSQPWISYHLSMLRLEPFITPVILYQLSEFQARAVLAAPEQLQEQICEDIKEQYRTEKTLPSASEIQKIITDYIELNYEDVEKCGHCKHQIEGGVCDLDDGECRFEEALPETGPAQLPVQERPLSEPGQQEKQPPDHEHVYDAGSTYCRICGRELTAPESVAAGIGPICASGKSRSSPEDEFNAHLEKLGIKIPPRDQTSKPTPEEKALMKEYERTHPKEDDAFHKLSRYYPFEVMDTILSRINAESYETMLKYCRRYVEALHNRTPDELKNTILREILR